MRPVNASHATQQNVYWSDAAVIDAQGRWVLPGFIDAHTHVGLHEEAEGWAGSDTNELTDPVTARALSGQSGVEVLQRGDGALLALFAATWRLSRVQRDFPDAYLEPLVAAST